MIGALQMGRWDSGNMNESHTIPSMHTYIHTYMNILMCTEYEVYNAYLLCTACMDVLLFKYGVQAWCRVQSCTAYFVHAPSIDNGRPKDT